MALEIYWTKQASDRFDEIIEYLITDWGDKSVRLFVKDVYNFLDILSEFPEIGTIENKELNIRGIVVRKQLTLFYQIRNDEVIFLNFYDNRQNPENEKFDSNADKKS